MAGTLVMEEAAGLKENSISAGVGRGHFGQPRKGGKLHQGKSVGEARRKDRSGVLAPNSTKGNCGSVEKTLDSFKDRVAQQHKLYGSQPDLAAGLRPLASKHASLGPGGKLTFAPSKPAVSRNVHGTLAAREPGLSASLNSSIFRSVSPDREADLSSLGDQGKFKEQQRYENLIENKAMHKRTSPSLKVYPSARSSVWQSDSEPRQCLLAADRETASESRNRDQQHGPKWTNFTPQLRISSESKTPCSPTGGLQSLRNSASRLETTNVKFPTGGLQKLRNSASRVETTNVKFAAGDCKSPDAAGSAAFGSLSSPRTDSKCSNTSPSIVALLYRIKKDRREDSRTQKVRKSPRVSSGSVFKRQGTPHKHTAFPSGRGEAIRKFGDAIQLSENKTGSGPGPDHYDERDDADMNSAVSIDLSPPRQGMRSEASEIEFTSNAVVGGGKSSKCADNAGGESGLVVAKAHPVLTIEETRIRAQLRCAWEATTRSRSNSSWSSVSSLTYGSELILENAIPKRNISDMEISSGGSMLMTLEVTGASSNASSSTHCFSDSSLLQKSTTGMAFPNVQHPSTGGITATADEESLKSCVVVNPSLTTPQLTGNDPSPPDPFMISSKVSPNSRPLKLPSRRINKLSGAPSRVLRNARSDEPQSCNSAFSDAGAAASVSENDYNIQRLRQGDSISMRSSEGPVMESLSSSGLTIEKAEVNASQLESPPWSGLRNTKQPKVRGAFGGGDIFENADHKSCADERKASFTAMCAENRFDEGTADAARDTQQPHAAPVLAESREPASIESLSKFVTRESEGAYPTFPSARDILMMKPAARRVVRASGGSSSGAHSLAHDGLADRRPTLGYQAVEGRSGCPEDMSGHGDRDDFRQSGRKDSRTVVSRSQLESNVGRVVSANSQLITEEVGDSARREETKGLLATERPGALAGRLKMALDVSYEEKRPDKHIPSKNVYDVPPDSGVRKHANDVESWSGRQDLPVSGAGEGSGQRDISLTGPASVSKGGPTNEAMSHVHVDMRQNEEKINTSGISVSNGLSSLSLEEGTDMMEISRDELPPQNLVNSRGTTSSVARSCQVSHSTSPKHQSRSPVLVPQSNPDSALRKCSRDQTRSSPTSPEQDQDKKSDERPIQNLKPLPDRRLGETPNAAISTPSVENNAKVPVSAAATTETAQNVASVKTAAATSSSKKITENSQFVWVNNKRYQKLGKIGKGGSSEVYKVIDSECNIYALKKIPLKGREPSIARSFYQEIEYLEGLRGKRNVVQLIAYEVTNTAVIAEGYQEKITDDACIYMVLEYGEIDLAGILSKKRKQMLENSEVLDDNWLRFYWELMLLAVKTIHDERIVHADLKPANFLLVKGELKLIDFGIAKAIQNDTTHIVRDSQVGTVNYMSPEAFMTNTTDEEGRKVKCGRSSDIWSLGCILYQMVYGRLPFSNIDSFYAKIHAITSKESKIEFQPVKNIWLLDCMKRCLTWDRYSRPHISDLLEHPFLRPERASQYTLIG